MGNFKKIIFIATITFSTISPGQTVENHKIHMFKEIHYSCKMEGGGNNFCTCYANHSSNSIKPSDYIVAKTLEKNGLSIENTRAWLGLTRAAEFCSSKIHPTK